MKSNLHAFIDLETSGLDAARYHIVEVGVAVFLGRQEIASYSELVNPGEEAILKADPKAMAVNGILPADLKNARPMAVVAETLQIFLRTHRGLIHAYNNEFEMSFLTRAPWNVAGPWGDCIQLAAREVMAEANVLPLIYGKPKRPRLSEAAAFFGVPQFGRAHRSLSDARVAALIYAEILDRRRIDDEVSELIEDGA